MSEADMVIDSRGEGLDVDLGLGLEGLLGLLGLLGDFGDFGLDEELGDSEDWADLEDLGDSRGVNFSFFTKTSDSESESSITRLERRKVGSCFSIASPSPFSTVSSFVSPVLGFEGVSAFSGLVGVFVVALVATLRGAKNELKK